jgi:2-polyprenyl-3-methyl-5-hydroxy-6-metoxy-1,4-benzoquinol methylase
MHHQPPSERLARIQRLNYEYDAQPKVDVEHCNLCGHEQFVILTHCDRYGFAASASACRQCGLVFLSPVMTASAYQVFYGAVYRPLVSAYHGRRIDAETIQDEQREYAAALAQFLQPFLKQNPAKTLLDIGGSTGVVAHYLATRFGLEATVLDPSPLEIEQAKKLGIKSWVGLLEDLDPQDSQFDLIVLCQTVDHLLDIRSAMAKICQMLQPNGLFFVDIVDFRAAYLRNWSLQEAVKIDHPFYLTESTIEAYLTRAGFHMIRINYAADHLHIGYLCRLGKPQPNYLPSRDAPSHLLSEVRFVQNSAKR